MKNQLCLAILLALAGDSFAREERPPIFSEESEVVVLDEVSVFGIKPAFIRFEPSPALIRQVDVFLDGDAKVSGFRIGSAEAKYVSPYDDPLFADRIPIVRTRWYKDTGWFGDDVTVNLKVGVSWEPKLFRDVRLLRNTRIYFPVYVKTVSPRFNFEQGFRRREKSKFIFGFRKDF